MYEAREQRTVIEMLCDKSRTGLEGEWESKEKGKGDDKDKEKDKGKDNEKNAPDDDAETERLRSLLGRKADGTAGIDDLGYPEKQLKKADTALLWEGYGHSQDDKVDILRLTWHTKYACENGSSPSSSDNSWGFFTWIVIM